MTAPAASEPPHRVVIVGGGFGGLNAAQALDGADCQVTLIDRRNFHLFQPLLYQVATGGLSPANISAPLRSILKRQENVEVVLGEATAIDPREKRVVLADGSIPYDTLIVAAGAAPFYFNNDSWAAHAPGLKSVEDATDIRRRILLAFENAERLAPDCKEERERLLTFVVVGAGPTGVEMAGAIGELARHTLRADFRRLDPSVARVILVEFADRVLPPYPEDLSAAAKKQLEEMGVAVKTGCKVTSIEEDRVVVENPAGEEETIDARNVIWAAGVRASPLAEMLARATGLEIDRGGKIPVRGDCSLAGYRDIFAIGDMARFEAEDGETLPGLAPVAIQQAKYVAKAIRARLRGDDAPGRFEYHDRGTMATIGPAAAVVDLGRWRFSGLFAWLVWLFVHLMMLVGFENRLLVFTQWAWNYFTRNRSARLITGVRAEDLLWRNEVVQREFETADKQRKESAHDESPP